VTQNSPAAQAGLVARCSIVKIDGVPIHTTDDVFLAIGTALAGSQIKIEVMPGPGAPVREHVAELAKYYLPSEFIIASNRPPALAGLRVDYTSTLVRSSDLRAIPDGVVIREVLPSSAAERANLQKERIIIKVNGRPVNTPAEYYHEVQNATGPLELTLSNNETVKIPLR
jgi:S1-C subfamily serine protease